MIETNYEKCAQKSTVASKIFRGQIASMCDMFQNQIKTCLKHNQLTTREFNSSNIIHVCTCIYMCATHMYFIFISSADFLRYSVLRMSNLLHQLELVLISIYYIVCDIYNKKASKLKIHNTRSKGTYSFRYTQIMTKILCDWFISW